MKMRIQRWEVFDFLLLSCLLVEDVNDQDIG